MNWRALDVSPCRTHHIDEHGRPAYDDRFDEVLKFHAPGLAPVRRDDAAWHVESDGSAAYDRRFLRSFGYYEALAAVVGPSGWHHVTPDGTDAYAARFAWCGNFQSGRCAVRDRQGQYYHVTPEGEPAYRERWRYVGDFRDGVAVVQASDGCSTHIRIDGALVHGRWFVDADVFHKGFARARDTDGWMHVDREGRPVYARRFHDVEPFYNGQARVERFDGGVEVVGENGERLVEVRAARRSEFAALSSDMVGFWKTQTIATAVELGVIEALPASADEIANRCALRPDGTERLLRGLGELGLVIRGPDGWALCARGEFLRRDHAYTLAHAAIEYARPFTAMWGRLSDAIRRDTAWVAPDVFEEVARDHERRIDHHVMLRSYARHDYDEVCRVLDLQGAERVIDGGGGLGVLAQAIRSMHPHVDVTIIERPEVVSMAPDVPGIQWMEGDLRKPWGVTAEAVLLSRVLHDWDDADAAQILAHARACLARGGRLYIVEMLLADGCVAGSLCDLHLLAVTGGRERSVDGFRRLLSVTGFDLAEIRRLPALPSVIVGIAT